MPFGYVLLTVFCTYQYPLFLSWRLSTQPSSTGWRPTSPPSREWCTLTVPVSGLDRRSGSNWQGPWLALCARPLPCPLIGTSSVQQRGRDTAVFRLMDGHWCQESFFLTRALLPSTYYLRLNGQWMHLRMYLSSFVINISESWLKYLYCSLCSCSTLSGAVNAFGFCTHKRITLAHLTTLMII